MIDEELDHMEAIADAEYFDQLWAQLDAHDAQMEADHPDDWEIRLFHTDYDDAFDYD